MSCSYSFSPQPERLGSLRAGSTDTRGDNLYDVLNPVSDPLTSVSSITVARLDNKPIGAGDLTITPNGMPAPWITVYPGGAPSTTGYVVNWWTTAGASIASSGPVDYQITVTALTVAGRVIVHDIYLQVVASIG